MDYTDVLPVPLWQPLHTGFSLDVAEVIKVLLPRVQVDARAIRNRPSPVDPLGATPRVTFGYTAGLDGPPDVSLSVDGEETPAMKPDALELYLYVQWPELFRRAP